MKPTWISKVNSCTFLCTRSRIWPSYCHRYSLWARMGTPTAYCKSSLDPLSKTLTWCGHFQTNRHSWDHKRQRFHAPGRTSSRTHKMRKSSKTEAHFQSSCKSLFCSSCRMRTCNMSSWPWLFSTLAQLERYRFGSTGQPDLISTYSQN